MPKLSHTLECEYTPSFRTSAIASMFDLPPSEKVTRHWQVDMPFENLDWKIGLIYGPSGSGKTSLAKRIFGDAYHQGYQWNHKNSVVDDFPRSCDIKTITKAMSSVGFSSPPDWVRPFAYLSNGQQFRVEVARLLLDEENYPELAVLDEFTSLVDRTVAKASCAAVSRYVRNSNKKFVGVTCHSDVIEWLNPDWTYEVESGEFTDFTGRPERRHPPIDLKLTRLVREAWFRSGIGVHHYLNPDILRSAHVWAATWENRVVGMCCLIRFPHNRVKNGWRTHRTVVYPDFQGLRIGVMMNDALADYYCRHHGFRVFGVSTHPAMNTHRRNSESWMLRRQAGTVGKPTENGKITGQSVGRATEAFEYVGFEKGHTPFYRVLEEEELCLTS